jgi:hypothetical protein
MAADRLASPGTDFTLGLASFKAIEQLHHVVHDAGRRALAALANLPA